MENKGCSRCKIIFSPELFYKSKVRRDGYDTYCKKCRLAVSSGNFLWTKDDIIPAAKILTMDDFYPKAKKWKKLDTWNKYDSARVDELLYNGGDVSEAFYNNVYEKQDYEKSKKIKNKWGKKDK
jgi:hypothetical protein